MVPCTVIDFVSLFTTVISQFVERPAVCCYARYLSELVLLHDQFLNYKPSLTSAAICSYSLLAAEQPHWVRFVIVAYFTSSSNSATIFQPEALAKLSGYKYEDLVQCIIEIQDWQRRIDPSFEFITQRYSRAANFQVAEWQIPPTIPGRPTIRRLPFL